MTQVAIYVRESRDDYGISYETIETQKSLLEKFINEKSLGELYAIYEDDNYSGVNFERPGIKKLLCDASAGKFQILVAKDLSRLGRSNARTLLFLECVEEYGVRVITYDGRYDSLRDAETVGIDSWFNERYVIDISRKIRTNLRHKIEKGEYIGNAPYGYIKSKEKHNTLEINIEEAVNVKKIYRLYLEGYGYKKIAEVMSKTDKSKVWNHSQIKRILTSRVYIGDTVQGVSERVSYKSKKTRSLPEDKWVITKGTHAPIIDKKIYDMVQQERKKRQSGSRNYKKEVSVFKGLIFCALCDKPMYSRKQGKINGYSCSTYEKYGKDACKRHFVSEDMLLENIFIDLYNSVKSYIEENQDIRLHIEKIDCEIEKKIRILDNLIESSLRKQKTLYYDRLEERISTDIFESVYQELQSNIDRYMDEKDMLCKMTGSKDDSVTVLLNTLRDHTKPDKNTLRQIISIAVDKIVVEDREICIVYNI